MIKLFEDTFKDAGSSSWALTVATGGAAVIAATATDRWMTDGRSLQLTTGTSGSNELHRFMGRRPEAKNPHLFWKIVFATLDENITNFAWYLSYRDDTDWKRAKLLHVNSTNVWSWQDSAGVAQTFLTRDTAENTARAQWHTVVMGIDLTADKWSALVVDEVDATATVRGQALRSTADTAVPNMYDFALETTNTATPGVIVIDSSTAWLGDRDGYLAF